MINPYAIGKTIYLRAPGIEDLEGPWYEWFSDPETTQFLSHRFPNTRESQKAFFESVLNSRERLVLSICTIEDDKHIGVCNLSSINWIHRYSDLAYVIGNREYRNGRIIIEVVSLLLEIAFIRLNLRNLRSVYTSANPYTPALEKIFGFKEVGRLKDICWINGSYVDEVISQLKREDWVKRNRKSTI